MGREVAALVLFTIIEVLKYSRGVTA